MSAASAEGVHAVSLIPSISAIQRATWYLLALFCLALLAWSPAVALGCAAGGVVAGANLVALSWFTQLLFRAAVRGGKASPWLALVPLKLLLLVAVAYVAVWQLRLNPGGFALGVSMPLFATLFEVARARLRGFGLPTGSQA